MFILLLLSLIPYPVLKGPSMVELNMSREADCWPLWEMFTHLLLYCCLSPYIPYFKGPVVQLNMSREADYYPLSLPPSPL